MTGGSQACRDSQSRGGGNSKGGGHSNSGGERSAKIDHMRWNHGARMGTGTSRSDSSVSNKDEQSSLHGTWQGADLIK